MGITVAATVFFINFMASRQYRSFVSLSLAPRSEDASAPAATLASWWGLHSHDRQVEDMYGSVAEKLLLWYGPEQLKERTTISLQDGAMQLSISVIEGSSSSSSQVALAVAENLRSDIADRGGDVLGRTAGDLSKDLSVRVHAEPQPLGPDREDVYVGIISGGFAAALAAIVFGNGGIRSMLRSYRSQTG